MYFRGTTFSKRVSVLLAVALLAGVECMAQKHNVLTAKDSGRWRGLTPEHRRQSI